MYSSNKYGQPSYSRTGTYNTGSTTSGYQSKIAAPQLHSSNPLYRHSNTLAG